MVLKKCTNRTIMEEIKAAAEEELQEEEITRQRCVFTVVRGVLLCLKGRKHCVKEERREKATIPDTPLRIILIRG